MIGKYNYGTGRRKSSVARVFLKSGKGNIVVNDKPADEYFSRVTSRMILRQPLALTDNESSFDIMVNVVGGGESGHGYGHAQPQRNCGHAVWRVLALEPRCIR